MSTRNPTRRAVFGPSASAVAIAATVTLPTLAASASVWSSTVWLDRWGRLGCGARLDGHLLLELTPRDGQEGPASMLLGELGTPGRTESITALLDIAYAEDGAVRAALSETPKSSLDRKPMQAHLVQMQEHLETNTTWTIPDNVPLFTMATVARAADVPPATVRAWFQRGHVSLNEGDSKAHTKGAPNRFTLRSVLMLAATAELVRLGTTPGAAFVASEHWMIHGVLKGQYGAPARREGGGLFPHPFKTYLVIGADGVGRTPNQWPCEIVAIDPHSPTAHSAFFNALFFRGRGSAKIVLLNMLDRRVRQICYETILGKDAPNEPDWEAEFVETTASDTAVTK
ncbi:hypothetical protein [Sphingomonas sp. CFBP9019]|uniref:hypothetical protein n=1 Tax=Sphingomonas sp. CFBP9019 TaxID=3096532 RepID=UPI002A69D463|nr:hypothetical protein [Sphingomonas sp. CFBP9019]MDY1008961.1 hypothetical protein [Sphingomonas sp. CFBP9019]